MSVVLLFDTAHMRLPISKMAMLMRKAVFKGKYL
jgi:hypothetical protein